MNKYLCVCVAALIILVAHQVDGAKLGTLPIYSLPKDVVAELTRFFGALDRNDKSDIYSYASSRFRERVTEKSFERATEAWALVELEVVYVYETIGSGFMLIINYRDEARGRQFGDHGVFFWKLEEGKPRFMNFPFVSSRVPGAIDLESFYENG